MFNFLMKYRRPFAINWNPNLLTNLIHFVLHCKSILIFDVIISHQMQTAVHQKGS